ncbi:MAG: GFA family protein, partial [Geminicoccaceae bacterium]
MCRKASGAPFAGFVEFPEKRFQWTEGQPRPYASSSGVIRRFCSDCGSSLTFEADGIFFISLGSLDTPEQVVFNCNTYTGSCLPGVIPADGLPQCAGPAGGKGGQPLD